MEKISGIKTQVEAKEITSFACSPDIKEALWRIADANDCTLSDVIRFGLKEWLKGVNLCP